MRTVLEREDRGTGAHARDGAAAVRSTERALRDVVALSTLPAAWHGAEPTRIAESLAAALFTTIQPEFAYVALLGCSDEDIAVAQTGRYRTDPAVAAALGPALLAWARAHDPDDLMAAPNPVGPGTLRVATRALGFGAECGVIAAGFLDETPDASQLLLLNIAATQATTAVQNTRLMRTLRESEERYRRLVRLMPAAVYTCEAPSGVITFYNEHAAALWGRVPRLGDTDERFCGSFKLWRLDGSPLPHGETPMAQALAEGREFRNQEVVIERPDGSRITVLVNIDPIRDGAGHVVGAVNVFHDTTELKQAERAVRASEERFRTLVSLVTDVPWTTDAAGAFTRFQPAWAAFSGQPWEEHRGFGWVNAIHPEDRERVTTLWERACRSRSLYESSGRLWQAATGQYRHFVARATPVLAPDGSVVEWVGTCTDVTAEREASAEREELLASAERARAEAEAANRTKDDFLAVLSHELRSPMHAMLGWLRILKMSGAGDPALVDRAVETLERNIWVQVQVINDLLDVSRILSGKLQLDPNRLELGALVRGCVESLRPSAEAKELALRLVADEHPLEVVGDGARLQQVVGNLLGNAVKFTNAGGTVTVGVGRAAGMAQITVEDTGQGIAPEFVPHLFERFRQADSSRTRAHGGLGLGLSIAKNLIALHGGEIRAESEGPGRGARFTVAIPLAEPRALLVVRPVPATPAADERPDVLDVLVVDDDPDTRTALAHLLGDSGARVRTAGSVREALAAYAERPPDVLVSDIGMPGEDGYVLIRAIREREEGRGRRTLAVAMTGFAGRQDHEMALRAGFDEHVAKPVEPEVLVARMRALAASRGGPVARRSA